MTVVGGALEWLYRSNQVFDLTIGLLCRLEPDLLLLVLRWYRALSVGTARVMAEMQP